MSNRRHELIWFIWRENEFQFCLFYEFVCYLIAHMWNSIKSLFSFFFTFSLHYSLRCLFTASIAHPHPKKRQHRAITAGFRSNTALAKRTITSTLTALTKCRANFLSFPSQRRSTKKRVKFFNSNPNEKRATRRQEPISAVLVRQATTLKKNGRTSHSTSRAANTTPTPPLCTLTTT